MKRREFIGRAAALAGICTVRGAFAALRPSPRRARFGVLSDIHVTTDAESCDVFEHALRYFDAMKCDGVLLCGDIADYGLVDELKAAGDTWFRAFPDGRRSDGEPIAQLFHYGDHDMGGYMHKRVAERNHPDKVIPLTDPATAWEAAFREKWSPIQVKTVKGYTFILAHHPRHTKKTAYGQRIPGIAEALAQCAPKDGRPFFFSQHRIIKDTAGGPWAGGQEGGESREALNGYSNAVAFCGHGHVEAQDERSIWQREFTAVEVPSLRYVSIRAGRENSRGKDDSPSKMMGMVNTNDGKQGLLMDVYDDRIVLFRRDFVNDCEIAAPWEIPLPFGRGEKPYDPELRRRREVAPQFEEGAKVTVRRRMARDRAGFEHKDAYDVSFPSVRSSPAHPRAFDYEVTAEAVEADVVRVLKQKRVFSYYGHCPEHLDSRPVACVFSLEELSSKAKRIRFRVRPCGCFGAKGREIVSPFEARLDNKP